MMNHKQTIDVLFQNMPMSPNSIYEDVMDVLMYECSNYDEVYNYLYDVSTYGCISGIVGHLTYNSDIKEYFYNNSESINDIIFDIQMELGEKLVFDADKYSYIETFYTWVAYEHACYMLLSVLDNYEEE